MDQVVESSKRSRRYESEPSITELLADGATDEEEEEGDGDASNRHRKKKQRRSLPNEHAIQPLADENPLFFRLHHNSIAATPAASASASASSIQSLVIHGTACTIHPIAAETSLSYEQSHLQWLSAPSYPTNNVRLEEEIISTTNPGLKQPSSDYDYQQSVSPTSKSNSSLDTSNAASSSSHPTVLVDRFDVRLLLPESELLLLDLESHNDLLSSDSASKGAIELTPDELQRTIESLTDEEMKYELLIEGGALSDFDIEQLRIERYGDLVVTKPEWNGINSTEGESEKATHEIESRGNEFQFSYINESLPVNDVPVAAPSSTSISPKRVPPPPPPRNRKVPPPPPPRRPPLATNASSASSAPKSLATEATTARSNLEDASFNPPFNVPEGTDMPSSLKSHRLMLHTCKYVQSLGPSAAQQEIVLKVKQQHNEAFNFLNYDDPFHRYYMWLKEQNIVELEKRIQQQLEERIISSMTVGETAHSVPASSTPKEGKPTVRPPPGVKPRANVTNVPPVINNPSIATASISSAAIKRGISASTNDEAAELDNAGSRGSLAGLLAYEEEDDA